MNVFMDTISRSFLVAIFLTTSSCSTFVGNVKPIDEKSDDYGVLNLARDNSAAWRQLNDSQLMPPDARIGENSDVFSSEITDLAFQSKRTSAIVSLNSSCRQGRERITDLRPYLNELFLGISDVTERIDTPFRLSGANALEGRVTGKMAGQDTRIRAVVVASSDCIYDLMYISRPTQYSVHEGDFNRFISSLRLR